MPETTVTLVDVDSRDVTARGEQTTVYSFRCDDGRKYDTFRRDVAVPGSQLRGKRVVIGYTEKQWDNGEKSGINYNLNSIKEAAGDPGVAVDLRSDEGNFAGPVGPIGSILGYNTGGSAAPTNKDLAIARAVALKAAVETASRNDWDYVEIIRIADVYLGWLLNGSESTPVSGDGILVNF